MIIINTNYHDRTLLKYTVYILQYKNKNENIAVNHKNILITYQI